MDLPIPVLGREGLILIRWLHLLAAVIWVGGIWFNTMILGPSAARLPNLDRQAVQRSILPRFFLSCWTSMALLLLTGVLMSLLRIRTIDMLWTSGYGIVFLLKHFLFFTMMLHSATITFYFTPRIRAAQKRANSPELPPDPILDQYNRYLRLTRYPHLITGLLAVLFGSILLRS